MDYRSASRSSVRSEPTPLSCGQAGPSKPSGRSVHSTNLLGRTECKLRSVPGIGRHRSFRMQQQHVIYPAGAVIRAFPGPFFAAIALFLSPGNRGTKGAGRATTHSKHVESYLGDLEWP